jgi:hypothetical protein
VPIVVTTPSCGLRPIALDLLDAARRQSLALQKVMVENPRELYAFVQYAYVLFDEGRHVEGLLLCNAILSTVENAAPDSRPPYDDLEHSLSWVYHHKAAALRALGRWEEGWR